MIIVAETVIVRANLITMRSIVHTVDGSKPIYYPM